MMGSPFYYDVLFDEGPGDVVFHDCMWSGICTCCIQLLHQDSFYYTNESPDLKADLSSSSAATTTTTATATYHQQQHQLSGNTNSSSCLTKESHHYHTTSANNQFNSSHTNQQQQDLKVAGHLINHHNHNYHMNNNNNNNNSSNNHHTNNNQHHLDSALALSSTSTSPVTASFSAINNNKHTSPGKAPNSATSKSISPDTAPSSNSTSPDTASSLSNSTSPKPVRRREHNDSERKRRDHLRNAFNFLRDQVPRFKAISKKPPRIQILHEATTYVRNIIKESQELERRLDEERAKHERLQNL